MQVRAVAAFAAVLCCAAAQQRELSPELLAKFPHLERFKDTDFQTNRYVFAKGGPAEQVHLAYAGQNTDGYPTGVNVAWVYGESKTCFVNYGTTTALGSKTGDAPSARYLHEGGHHFNIDILGLPASTRHYYTIECDGKTTQQFTFETAAATNQLSKPYTMAVFGDMGWLGSDERPMVLAVDGLVRHWDAKPVRALQEMHMQSGGLDAAWIVGDIGYADDAFAHDVVGGLYEKCYDGYMNWMQNISANVPWMASVGNHESECHSTECVLDLFLGPKMANFSAYNTRFHMPSQSSGGVLNMWYSWNVGPVHFVSINTETDFPGAGEEKKGDSGIFNAGGFGREGEYMAWLEADLAQALADKKSGKRPFIVAGGHRPCCSPDNLMELFDKYEVDLFVAGHAHTYARSVRSCERPACGTKYDGPHETTFIYSGASGNDEATLEGTTSGPTANSTEGSFATPEQSLGLLTIVNQTTLQWRLQSAYGGLRIIDQFYLQAKYKY